MQEIVSNAHLSVLRRPASVSGREPHGEGGQLQTLSPAAGAPGARLPDPSDAGPGRGLSRLLLQ